MVGGHHGKESACRSLVLAPPEENGGCTARLDLDDNGGAVVAKPISCDRGRQMNDVADDAQGDTAAASRAVNRRPPSCHDVGMNLGIGGPTAALASNRSLKRTLAEGGAHAASPHANAAISSARGPTIPTVEASRCSRRTAVVFPATLLVSKFVEGRTVAVRPFRVLGATALAAVGMAVHAAAWLAEASWRRLATLTSLRPPKRIESIWPDLRCR